MTDSKNESMSPDLQKAAEYFAKHKVEYLDENMALVASYLKDQVVVDFECLSNVTLTLQEFKDDPKAFIAKLRKARGNTEEFRGGSDPALNFMGSLV